MKRGFLLKAGEKKNTAAKGRTTGTSQQLQAFESKKTEDTLGDVDCKHKTRRADLLPKFGLPYGNLTDEEKALPEDYDKDRATKDLVSVERGQVPELSAGKVFLTTIGHPDDSDGSTEWVITGTNANLEMMKTKGFPSRTPKPHRPDLCQVRTTPDMGEAVFAKRNLMRGDLIFSERPLLVAPNWFAGFYDKKYTDRQSSQIMMFEFEKVLEAALKRMGEKERALYMGLYNSHTTDGTGPLLGIMRTNAFRVSALSGSDGLMNYSAICNLASRINHSCMPNVESKFKDSSFSFQFIASKDIKAGEQLFISYCDIDRTKAERQIDLAPYGFSCNCPACVNATPATDKLRKTFLDQIAHHYTWAKQPEWTDAELPSALLLEKEIVAEGLDAGCPTQFFSLLMAIYLSYRKLGKRVEAKRYIKLLEAQYRIYDNVNPFPMKDHPLVEV